MMTLLVLVIRISFVRIDRRWLILEPNILFDFTLFLWRRAGLLLQGLIKLWRIIKLIIAAVLQQGRLKVIVESIRLVRE